MNKISASLLLAVLSVCIASSVAFVPSRSTTATSSSRSTTTSLYGAVGKAKPKFNKQTDKWERSPADDGKYPYDAFGALLRHGPPAFISRVTDAAEYEQFVLNYMAVAGVDRVEATGNIDAKLANPVDWNFQKMEEKKGKPKVDYTELKPKNAILAIIWALGITPLTVNVIQQTVSQWGQGIAADAYGRH